MRKEKLHNSLCCCLCLGMMKALNVHKVAYSTSDGEIIEENINDMETYLSSGTKVMILNISSSDPIMSLIREGMG